VDTHRTKPTDVTLVYSVDQRNVNAMLVSLFSVLENTNGLQQVCVLYTGKNQTRLNRAMDTVCGETPYRVIDAIRELEGIKREAFPVGTIGEIAYLKFHVPDFVETRRALFLDADTVARADLRSLYEQDLGGKPIGAVQDWLVPTVMAKNSPIRNYLEQDCDAPYFNSGVMLMDIERLRSMNLIREAAKLREVKVQYADQDLFNLIFAGNWAVLDPVWNYPIDRTLVIEPLRAIHSSLWANRKISHYMGTKKPWIFPFNIRSCNRDFNDYRNRSSLKYWIPNPLSPSSLRYYVGFFCRKLGIKS
jgi:lipopolysaccharide biosynthesis glycosyltransferase